MTTENLPHVTNDPGLLGHPQFEDEWVIIMSYPDRDASVTGPLTKDRAIFGAEAMTVLSPNPDRTITVAPLLRAPEEIK